MLIFIGKPIISGTGLDLTLPEIIYIEGSLLDALTLQDLTDGEQTIIERMKAEKKEAVKGV